MLAATFGFGSFRPGQERVVEALLAGRSALAVFPTGAGKSLCYQLPALLLEGVTIVVSPLIALMKDQIDFLQRRGIEAARLDSSLGAAEQREIVERLRAGALKLLYVAPERFNNERFLAQLARTRISLFAVDEAHCISEWGHNFRPDYLKLAERARELAAERVLALTATATPAVVADIRAGFGIEEADAVVTGFYRPNLTLLTTPVAAGERDGLLLERLRERPPGSTIVYVTLQRTSLRVAELLADAGLPARPYHAGMGAEERVAVQEWWAGSPDGIVVATIAFGMGIDKADVRYVYHYNLPKSLESYSQEIGRAGRDGEESICELLRLPGRRADARELRLRRHANARGARRPARGRARASRRRGVRRLRVRALRAPRPAPARAQDGPHLPRARRRAQTGNALLRGLPAAPARRASFEDVFGRFDESRAGFLRRLIASGKTGRTWTTLAPDDAAAALGEERSRIVAALEYLDQQGLVELQPAEVRQRYTLTRPPGLRGASSSSACSSASPAASASETERIENVLSLVTHDGCQVRALVGYFGETRAEPLRALQPLPDRATRSSFPSPSRSRRSRRASSVDGPRGAARWPSRRARHAETAGAIPRRHHEPGDEPREADQGPALRLARRTSASPTCSPGARRRSHSDRDARRKIARRGHGLDVRGPG